MIIRTGQVTDLWNIFAAEPVGGELYGDGAVGFSELVRDGMDLALANSPIHMVHSQDSWMTLGDLPEFKDMIFRHD